MLKKAILCFSLSLVGFMPVYAQDTTGKTAVDSSIYYDELFNELEDFLDSLTAPKSYTVVSLSLGSNYLNYKSAATTLASSKKFIYSPSFGYFDKSGLGIGATASVVRENNAFNAYQFAATASYDYVQSRKAAGGVSYTRFFTRDSLSFYTSPLQNELFAYATYRGWWVRPSVTASYGWGSRTEVQERENMIKKLKKKKGIAGTGTTETTTTESVSDFTVTASVKHDFYWLSVLTEKDYFRLTPQFSFVSGTQQFGFNQTTNSYVGDKKSAVNVLYNSENVQLSEKRKFAPLSLMAFLKSEFSVGKFFVQPQVVFNYYLPGEDNNLSTVLLVNTGFIF